MARKFLTPIDMTNLEVLNLRLHQSVPASPIEGLLYYNTTDDRPNVYTTSWETVPFIGAGTPAAETVGAAAAAGNSLYAARLNHVHAMPGLVTTSVDGFMSATDKTKLDNATSAATASTLVMRDASSRFRAADPSDVADVATKGYVDNVAAGMAWKPAVQRATTASIALTARTTQILTTGAANLSVDGANVADGQRILVKDGTTGSGVGAADNGIYVVSGVGSNVVLTRATDMDTFPEAPAAAVFVELGSSLADTAWVCTSDPGGTLGTDPITFAQFAGAATYTFITDTGSVGTSLKSADSTANQFVIKGIVAGSSKITLASSTANDVAVDVVEANLTLNNIGGTLSATKGGTGLTSYAQGDIIYASAANTLSALTAAATGNVLLSGTAPSWGKVGLTTHVSGTLPVGNGGTGVTSLTTNGVLYGGATVGVTAAGTQYQVLQANASGVPIFGAVNLGQAAAVTGTLPVGNGGTGATTLTQYAVLVGNGTSAVAAVSPSTAGQALVSTGATSNPAFGQINLTGSVGVTGVLSVGNGGTGLTTVPVGGILRGDGTNAMTTTTGTSDQVLRIPNGGGLPTFGAINISNGSAAISGILGVANGGTGLSTMAAAGALLVSASATSFSTIQASATAGLPLCNNGTGLAPTYQAVGATAGGTGQTTYTTGDILYASATNTLSKLAIGTTGYVLKVVAGVPAWAAESVTSPAGADRQIQFNNAGAFGASSGLKWETANYLRVFTADVAAEQAGYFVYNVTNPTGGFANGIAALPVNNTSTASTVARSTGVTTQARSLVTAASCTASSVGIDALAQTSIDTASLTLTSSYIYGVYAIAEAKTSVASTNNVTDMYGIYGSLLLTEQGSGTVAVTNAYGLYSGLSGAGTAATITSYYGLYLASPTGVTPTITNRYGIWQNDPLATNVFKAPIRLDGTTSGSLTVQAAATTTSYTLTMPSAVAVSNGSALVSDTSGNLSWAAVGSGLTRYAADVGDNTNTSLTVTHSLGTRDVLVRVYNASTYEEVECDVTHTSTSVVTLGFAVAPTTNQYRVVVVG